ncbi:response regulator transcription factor [Paenibacillus hamazuiensis]|uniref:response regulator transcription factor n=1 Tax=Paenibacillus hamazuiensis TaxID=2936508 RepID=UPI00200CB98A|nr:response regulator transcription factor [Paenibacillus hamazuiensis]
MGKTVLIVEDEVRLQRLLNDYLRHGGYETVLAKNGREALERFNERGVDLVLLDVMMPFLDGWSVCREMRAKSGVLILMLTARSEEEDKLKGYELGADDYITKPFSPQVLLAKIRALFKRQEMLLGTQREPDDILSANGLSIDLKARTVSADEEPVSLSPKEFDLLLYMAKNFNIALTRDKLLEHVWGYDYEGDERTLDTTIKRLRQKLGGKANMIETVKGVGYKFQVGK